MKTKTAELIGAQLDWAVAAAFNKQCNEDRVIIVCRVEATTPAWIRREDEDGSAPNTHRYSPSTGPQGDSIIDAEGISVIRCSDLGREAWCAEVAQQSIQTATQGEQHDPMYQIYQSEVMYGPTRRIAAMRAYVDSKLGHWVDLPETLK